MNTLNNNKKIGNLQLKKEVVLKTNKSDINYLSLKENIFNDLKYFVDNKDNELTINIFEYKTNQDKKNKIVSNSTTIRVKDLIKMGVRSYNKTTNNHTYRIKYIKEV